MSRRKTVLLITRGYRTRELFRDLALDLVRDHRVIVLPGWEGVVPFPPLDGVDVRAWPSPAAGALPLAALRDRAAAIEARLGISAYEAASNYLLYGRLVRQYGGHWGYLETETQVLSAFVTSYEVLSAIFEEDRPDLVFYETIDYVSSYVAFALALQHGVFGLEFRFAPFGPGRVFPAFGLFRRNPVLEYLYTHREEIAPESYRHAEDVLRAATDHLASAQYAQLHQAMMREESLMRRLGPALWHGPTLARGLRNLRWHLRRAENRAWLARHLCRELPHPPYVVFFLQHLPEASTCSEAPRWVYQDMIVEQLALHAPAGLTVAVKEHPRTYGSRGRGFFTPLQELPNVVTCHPSLDTRQLLGGAEAVVVVNGTAGLEGVLLGKRVGVLGRPAYSVYRGVRMLNRPEELYQAMADASWQPERMAAERRQFLAAYLQSTQEFHYGTGRRFYGAEGGAQWARALRAIMAFIESHGLRPADFDSGLFGAETVGPDTAPRPVEASTAEGV